RNSNNCIGTQHRKTGSQFFRAMQVGQELVKIINLTSSKYENWST
ncbi:hypothetical protein SS7213T_05111, partial [Staphylococcus simiae CCM 7213 = CCUG 51256]